MNADDERDSLDFTPEMALEDALRDFRNPQDANPCPPECRAPDKLLIIALWDDTPGTYATRFYNAGMKLSECITLCEIQKARFLRMMHEEGDETGN